jgi:hypothetical protein
MVLTITNAGPDPAAFVVVTNLLPSGLSFVSASVSQGICSYAGSAVVASLGTLNSYASATLVIETLAVAEGVLTNRFSIASLTPDPQSNGNASAAEIVVSKFPIPGGGGIDDTVPQLMNIPDRTVHAGSLVVVTNSIIGSTNAPTYSLGPSAPLSSFINPITGLFTWQTSDADVSTTNSITFRVSGNGSSAWTDSKSFVMTVISRPLIAGIAVNEGVVSEAWNSVIGQMYRLECSTNYTADIWSAASPDIVATRVVTTQTNNFDPKVWQFYRVRVLP